MELNFRQLHPHFVAEITGVDLRRVDDHETLAGIRAGLDQYAVLVFRDQPFDDEEQVAFTQRLDGEPPVESRPGAGSATAPADAKPITQAERNLAFDLVKVANVDENGKIVERDDHRRVAKLGNRIWHTDGSIVNPSGRYTLLSGRVVPPVRADTQFADMRAAYDALDADTKAAIEGLHVYYSLVYARSLVGYEFTKEEAAELPGAVHPIVRTIPHVERRSLYLGQHASHVMEWPIAEGRLLLRDLTEHATQPQFVYSHEWRTNDLLIWDNRATLHRARPFDDEKYRRDMRRTVTRDLQRVVA